MKKNDLILLITILVLSIVLFVGYRLFFYQSGNSVSIYIDGEFYQKLPLNNDASLNIPGADGGINHLEIKNGAASITDANCPDKLCVHQKKIQNNGESLVCLPHKVIVEVSSHNELDGIAN